MIPSYIDICWRVDLWGNFLGRFSDAISSRRYRLICIRPWISNMLILDNFTRPQVLAWINIFARLHSCILVLLTNIGHSLLPILRQILVHIDICVIDSWFVLWCIRRLIRLRQILFHFHRPYNIIAINILWIGLRLSLPLSLS